MGVSYLHVRLPLAVPEGPRDPLRGVVAVDLLEGGDAARVAVAQREPVRDLLLLHGLERVGRQAGGQGVLEVVEQVAELLSLRRELLPISTGVLVVDGASRLLGEQVQLDAEVEEEQALGGHGEV